MTPLVQVFTVMIGWLKDIFDMLLTHGGYIGLTIVLMPILSWLVRAVRSIIKK